MKTANSIWNKLIVGFICFMMVNVNITIDNQIIKVNMTTTTYAADADTDAGDSDPGVEQGESGTVNVEDDDGFGFVSDPTLNFIIFLSGAIVISRIMYICTNKTADMYLALAGALIYVAGELMTMFGAKAEISEKSVEFKSRADNGEIDDTQYQAIEKEKQVLEEVADAADKKATFQKASSVAFLAASGTSLGMLAAEAMALASCQSTTAAAAAAVPICNMSLVPVTKIELIKPVPQMSLTKSASIFSLLTSSTGSQAICQEAAAAQDASVLGTSGGSFSLLAASSTTACSAYVTLHGWSTSACTVNPDNIAFSFGALFTSPVIMLDLLINNFLTSSVTRGIVWGLFGIQAGIVAKATSDMAKQARENIKALDRILNKMDNSRMKSEMANSNIQKINLSGALSNNLSNPTELNEAMPCATGNGTVNQDTGQVTCPPVPPLKTSGSDGKKMTATGFEGMSNLANELIAGIQGNKEIAPSTNIQVGQLSAMDNAVKKKLRNNISKLNKINKALGKPAYNPKKEYKKMYGQMAKAVKKSLLDNGLTASGFMAKAGLSAPAKESKKVAPKSKTTTAMTKPAFKAKKKSGFKFDFNVDEEVAKRNAEFAKNEKAANAVEGEETKDGIIEDKEVNIFQAISIRYMKSGFKRLLDEL